MHSSEGPLVLNLQTGSITPQFHVIFEYYFSTVNSVEREIDPPEHWAELCLENSTFIPTDPGEDGAPTAVFLDDDWLTPDEREFKTRALTRNEAIQTTYEQSETDSSESTPVLPTLSVAPPIPRVARVSAPAASIPKNKKIVEQIIQVNLL
jgi:hypothetical protein